MTPQTLASINLIDHLLLLKDPRSGQNIQHKLLDIVVIALCAVLCGADDWDEIEEYGLQKADFLSRFLQLEHGIPSHDTFNRVFSMLESNEIQKCFLSWIDTVRDRGLEKLVAIDGKTLRRSFDRAHGKAAIHVLSAFACGQNLVLGQVKTSEKSNEITAIPELLKLLDLEGSLVSMDAMGCQKEVVRAVQDAKADYIICVKANQGRLHESLKEYFEELEAGKSTLVRVERKKMQEESGHGRQESRKIVASEKPIWKNGIAAWEGLKSVAMIESERLIAGELKSEKRYFISSLELNAEKMAQAVRSHWAIENSLHWVLDVSFGEDQCRKRNRQASFNFATLRKLVLNLLRLEKTHKASVKRKRHSAGWNDDYLLRVLGVS